MGQCQSANEYNSLHHDKVWSVVNNRGKTLLTLRLITDTHSNRTAMNASLVKLILIDE